MTYHPQNTPAPRATGRDIEEDKAMCSDLLGTYRHRLESWERGIAESCLNYLIKYPTSSISVKQAKYLDEIWQRHTDQPAHVKPKDLDDPTFDATDDIPF